METGGGESMVLYLFPGLDDVGRARGGVSLCAFNVMLDGFPDFLVFQDEVGRGIRIGWQVG